MTYEQPKGVPRRNEVDRTGERTVSEDGIAAMRPTVAAAVRSLRERMPAIRPNGIFKHPSDWTQEELDFIADSLKMNVPIYTIANMVHCEKHTLSRLIANTPELRQLKEEKYENLLDEAEYQADRLMKAGNSSIVIYVLQTLGRKRGWTTEDASSGSGEEGSRIVMGLIPEEDVAAAEKQNKALRGESGNVADVMTNPTAIAAVEDMVKDEVARKVAESQPRAVDVEAVSAPAYAEKPKGGESIVEMAERADIENYMSAAGGMSGVPSGDDPWAEGADSMFFQ